MSFVSQWNYDWSQKGVAHPRWSHIVITYPRPGYGKVEAKCEQALEENRDGGAFFTISQLPRLPRGIEFTSATQNTPRPIFDPVTAAPASSITLQQMAGAISQGVMTYGMLQVLIFSALHGAALVQEEEDATPPPPADPEPTPE